MWSSVSWRSSSLAIKTRSSVFWTLWDLSRCSFFPLEEMVTTASISMCSNSNSATGFSQVRIPRVPVLIKPPIVGGTLQLLARLDYILHLHRLPLHLFFLLSLRLLRIGTRVTYFSAVPLQHLGSLLQFGLLDCLLPNIITFLNLRLARFRGNFANVGPVPLRYHTGNCHFLLLVCLHELTLLLEKETVKTVGIHLLCFLACLAGRVFLLLAHI